MTSENGILILMGVLGIIFYCMVQMRISQKLSRAGNIQWHWWRTYVKKDAISIIISFIVFVAWYFSYGENAAQYKILANFKRTTFFASGAFGSMLSDLAFDLVANWAKKVTAKTFAMKYIDVKSNTSDMITGVKKTDSLDKVIEKGNSVTGSDVTQTPPAPKEVEIPENSNEKPS